MKKKISVFLSMVMLVCFANITYAYESFISKITISNGIISISGNTDKAGEPVTITLLKPGYDKEDLNGINPQSVITFMKTLISDDNGDYSESFAAEECGENQVLIVSSQDDYYSTELVTESNLTITPTFAEKETKTIHVSKLGNDETGDGTESNPYKTLEKARDILRETEKNEPVEVVIHEGEYNLDESFKLNALDSGEKGAEITYRAADGEDVIISGAKKIDARNFKAVTDEEITGKIHPSANGKIVEVNLADEGIDSDVIDFLYNFSIQTYALDSGKEIGIFLNGKKQTLSRWPNGGYAEIEEVSYEGSVNNATFDDGAILKLSGADFQRWQKLTDAFLAGCADCSEGEWWNEWIGIASVDSEGNITLKNRSYSGVTAGSDVYVVNLLEEIDIPGEWYIDRETSILYYYPPHNLTEQDVFEITTLNENLIDIECAEYLNFKDITFTKTAYNTKSNYISESKGGTGMSLAFCNNIEILNCEFSHIGKNGIYVRGDNITIDGCEIYDIGHTGVYVDVSGNDASLEKGNIAVKNCHIADVNNFEWLFSGAIYIGENSVGTEVKNNIIHEIPHNGLRFQGPEGVIEYNEIYNAVNDGTDQGAIYAGRTFGSMGSVVRYNYIHNYGMKDKGYFTAGVYLDDAFSGALVEKNIFNANNQNSGYGVCINGGTYNTVKDNVMLNVNRGVSYYAENNYYSGAKNNSKVASAYENLQKRPFTNSIYTEKYPEMTTIYNNYQNDRYISDCDITGNVIIGYSYEPVAKSGQYSESDISENVGVMELENDIFVNAGKRDFRITKEAKESLGISSNVPDESFDIESIGILGNYEVSEENKAFSLTYPENNELFAMTENAVQFSWERSDFADSYKYYIAKDREFNDIVAVGETRYTNVTVNTLEKDTLYYWYVEAVNTSTQIGYTEKSADVRCFGTFAGEKDAFGDILITDLDGNIPESPANVSGESIIIKDTYNFLENTDVYYYIGIYESNRLKQAYSEKKSLSGYAKDDEILRITLPEVTGNEIIKIFRWDEKMSPKSKAIEK